MLNGRLISQIFGSLLFLEAILMAVCLPISLIYGQHDLWAFLITIAIVVATGLGFRALGKGADNNMSRRDAYFVVTATWLLFSFFGMIPFLLCPLFAPPGDTMAPLSFTDAFFETISGFTTTGATVIDDVEALPKGSVRVFSAEATGPIRSKLHPRLSTGAKWIWMVYVILTVACVGSFLLCGMDWFNALNFAMTSTATGGFSTTNGSLASFHSPAEEYVCTLFCFLAGINFMLLYGAVAKMQLKRLFLNAEFRFYLLLTVLAVAFIMAELMLRSGYSLEPAFRYSLFQVVSFLTSTGLFNADAGQWPHVTWVVLALLMFVGGCSGSTSGGIKSIRGVMLLKIVRNEFRHILHPNAVLPLKIDDTNVPQAKRVTLLAFIALYFILAMVCAFVMIASGIDHTNSVTIMLSCLGNTGPTLGLEIGPTMSWAMLPVFAKWICAFMMLVGRLELFTVLVIFTPAFWKER